MEYKVETKRNIDDVVYVIEGCYTLKGVIKGVESKATYTDKDYDPKIETKYMVEMNDYRTTYSKKSIFLKDERELYFSLNDVAEEILDKHGIVSVGLDEETFGKDVIRVCRLKGESKD